jgi:transcriptional regulator with XRE-family HTH domain
MPKHFDKKLEIRRLTGMSQQEAAAMLGISREALALYESGKRLSLPGSATLFHALLIVEMNNAVEPPATDAPALSETARQQLRQKLEWIVKENRFQALKLQRQIDQYTLQQSQQQNRLRVLPCVEKVHAQLLEQSSGTPWKPVSTHQQKWLEMVKDFPDFMQPDEQLEVELALLRLRHQMLLHEAEEVEKMMEEMRD